MANEDGRIYNAEEVLKPRVSSGGRHFKPETDEIDGLFESKEQTESSFSIIRPKTNQPSDDTVVIDPPKDEAQNSEKTDGGTKITDAADVDATRVAPAIPGHELYISVGEKGGADARERGYPTDEYEPHEYGLADKDVLTYTSRGLREAHEFKSAKSLLSEEEEFEDLSRRDEVAQRLKKSALSDMLRAAGTFVLSAALLWIGFADRLNLPMPSFTADRLGYFITCLTLMLFVIAVNSIPLAKAAKHIFTGKSSADDLLFFPGVASLALIVYDFVLPAETGHFPLYAASFALCCAFADVWRAVRARAMLISFTIVGAKREKGVLVPVDDDRLSRDIMGNIISDGVTVYKPQRVGFITDFIKNSYKPDVSAHSAKILTYISLVAAALTATLSVLAQSGTRDSVLAACCTLLAFTPFSLRLVYAIPYSRAVKRLRRSSSTVIGYDAADKVNTVGAVVIDSNHLFPEGSISVDAVRTFGTLRIDDAIADAASVVCAAGGALSRIFLGVIDNDKAVLRHVDSLLYEDGLGLSAWVNERRVLVGTAELLRSHNVAVPSRDYEQKYSSEGQNLVYVSVGGELTAMFVVTYHARQEIYDILYELRRARIGVVVINRDCNITDDMIEKLFDMPKKLISIMTPTNEHLLGKSMEERCNAGIVYSKGLIGIGRSIISALRLVRAVSFANAVQVGGVLITVMLTLYLALTGSIAQFSLSELLICQSAWGLLTLIVARFRKA